ncbi:MAG: tRNA (adenosine(37)-N6)-threonylcarbamoyltransferase complex ATPase subunit type 1 TsaE [Candidatus Kapaibacterium sp.]
MDPERYLTHSEKETMELGRKFAERLQRGDCVTLFGDLGAGKTEFAKGICEYFQVNDIVSSPTYTIMNQYDGVLADGQPVQIYHIDLYRIKTVEELENVGFDECMHAHPSIKLVEWAERAEDVLPAARFSVDLRASADHDTERTVEITAVGMPEPSHQSLES